MCDVDADIAANFVADGRIGALVNLIVSLFLRPVFYPTEIFAGHFAGQWHVCDENDEYSVYPPSDAVAMRPVLHRATLSDGEAVSPIVARACEWKARVSVYKTKVALYSCDVSRFASYFVSEQ